MRRKYTGNIVKTLEAEGQELRIEMFMNSADDAELQSVEAVKTINGKKEYIDVIDVLQKHFPNVIDEIYALDWALAFSEHWQEAQSCIDWNE